MKIGIFSDTHFGFAEGTEREKESFENARRALQVCLEQEVDAILLPGDIFDRTIPSQETWREAFWALAPVKKSSTSVSALRVKKGIQESLHLHHTPIIGIHGNHEFRGKRFAGTLDVLEKSELVLYVHAGYIALQKGNERVIIHGMGGVPEKKARDALKVYNPVPLPGKKNILVLHQSYKELLPFDDDMIASLSFSDLPKGFDLIINGHFHELLEQDIDGVKFLIPGSTVITQMKQSEAQHPKCVCILDTDTMQYERIEIPGQKKLLFETIEFESAHPEEILAKVHETLERLLSAHTGDKPLVKIRLKGTLAKGVSSGDVVLTKTVARFKEKGIITVQRKFTEDSFKKKVEELRQQQQERKSISSMGLAVLEKNLAETAFSDSLEVKELFSLLEKGNVDAALELVTKKKPTS